MRDPSVPRGLPQAQGLYHPSLEHDACGIGFVASIKGHKSHDIIVKGIQVLINLTHRGACGCDPETGDGAGVLIQIPHAFFARECGKLGFTLPAHPLPEIMPLCLRRLPGVDEVRQRATRPGAIRNTFRNWDYPIRRQIFSGSRCAQDA